MTDTSTSRRLPDLVDYGWGRAPLREQLAGSGLTDEDCDRFDGHATAIIRLHVAGVITGPERDRAAARLSKSIEREYRRSAVAAGMVPSPETSNG